MIIGGPVEAPDPLNPDKKIAGRQHRHRDGARRSVAAARARSSRRRWAIDRNDKDFHNNFQDPEAFLRAGGRRGLQYVPLTDGTYFINRWFAIDRDDPQDDRADRLRRRGGELLRPERTWTSRATAFRHGERVSEGERGVQEKPLGPGKYAFNTYAGNIVLVPTTNFVLHWVTGRTESHRYDESLRSIDLVTKDAYEPTLPLSVVVHIDYQKAPT